MPGELAKCIGAEGVHTIRQEKESCVCCLYSRAFIGCVDNVTSESIARGEKMAKFDKTTNV